MALLSGITLLLVLLIHRVSCQELIQLQLFHAIGEDEFTPRGRIVVNAREAVSEEPVHLTDDEVVHFKDAANDTNKLYRVKAVTSTSSALAFTRACAIVESSFTNILTVYLDVRGQFIGIGVTAASPTCSSSLPLSPSSSSSSSSDSNRKKVSLVTTVNVVQTGSAPQPDTQSYVQRMEQEKLEKMKGDSGDNRSFLAKYWIYIVPLVIFMMITSASNPDAGGQ